MTPLKVVKGTHHALPVLSDDPISTTNLPQDCAPNHHRSASVVVIETPTLKHRICQAESCDNTRNVGGGVETSSGEVYPLRPQASAAAGASFV